METRHKVPLNLWGPVKDEILQVLRDVARRSEGKTISYSQLSAKLTKFPIPPESPALREMLCEVSESEDAAGRGMLSVVVVKKTGDKMPGNGFFNLATRLGRVAPSREALWISEMKLVHAANARGPRP